MPKRYIRYAVVGLGHIAQVAVLPAFGNARRNSRLTALVSGDPTKRRELAQRYGVEHSYSYEQYDECLSSGAVDAVYIALPNSLHCEYAVRAARAAAETQVRLMAAYRLHFERANLEAIEVARSGRIGELRLFDSSFTMHVVPGNIRVKRALGGGVLYDIGIYCINAARALFAEEPCEVQATTAGQLDEVEETVSATLRFPSGRVASFTCSFGAAKVSAY